MDIKFTLSLPRDAMSVPIVRRLLKSSMRTLGVVEDNVNDVVVALTEACTNVLDHAAAGDEYAVLVRLNDQSCLIDVIDAGQGFDPTDVGQGNADATAEAGRGIQLIRALVDRVNFRTRPEQGTVVHLEKGLTYQDEAPLRRLAERGTDTITLDLSKAQVALDERDANV